MQEISEALFAASQTEFSCFTQTDTRMDYSTTPVHGDYVSSLPFKIAAFMGKKPQYVAETLIAALPSIPFLSDVVAGGDGFINFYMKPTIRTRIISTVLKEKERYGYIENTLSAPTFNPVDITHEKVCLVQDIHCRLQILLVQLNTQHLFMNQASHLFELSALEQYIEIVLMQYLERFPVWHKKAVEGQNPEFLLTNLKMLAIKSREYLNEGTLLCMNQIVQTTRFCLLQAVSQVLNNGLAFVLDYAHFSRES